MPSDCIGPEELFECRRCGDCCKGFGGTYLTGEDIEAISRYIGTNPEEFCCSILQPFRYKAGVGSKIGWLLHFLG